MIRNDSRDAGKNLRVIPTETYFQLVRDELEKNGRAFVRVTGCSMWPLLHHLRDGVILIPPMKITPGDIVLFDRRNRRYALHRVIKVKADRFSMMGDHQWHIEHDLPCGQIVGVVSTICRDGRELSVQSFAVKAYAFAMCITAQSRVYLRSVLRLFKKIFTHR